MEYQDIRWQQRLANYKKALKQLSMATNLAGQRNLSDLEKQGMIQSFEYTHELAWNVMKDYLREDGIKDIIGSKSATRQAFKEGLIEDGDNWMDMIDSRNRTSHTYHKLTANKIVKKIIKIYIKLFINFQQRMEGLKGGKQAKLL